MEDNVMSLRMVCYQSFVAMGTAPYGRLSGWELTR